MSTLTTSIERQRGISGAGVVVGLVIGAFVFLLGIKLMPVYLEMFSVKKVMASLAQSEELKSGTVSDIRKGFDKRSVVDNIESVKGIDLEISKEGGETIVVAAWQAKVVLMKGYTLYVDFSVSSKDV